MDNLYNYLGSVEGMDSDAAAFLTFFLFFMGAYLLVLLLVLVFKIIARWIFFNKCKEEGWKAIIPVYNEITLLKISGLNWWWILIIYASSIFSMLQLMIIIPMITMQSYDYSIISTLLSFLSFPISIASIIAKVNESNNISKKFNKGPGHAALIFFFEPIMFLVMGLSKDYEYDKELDVPKNGFFGK